MTTADQLQLRALRLLNDGRRHSQAATRWARCEVDDLGSAPVIEEGISPHQFTLRELSLGATFDAREELPGAAQGIPSTGGRGAEVCGATGRLYAALVTEKGQLTAVPVLIFNFPEEQP